MHPSIAHELQFFVYEHLPPHLRAISRPFAELAHATAERSNNRETTAALQWLKLAKDAAVRAVVAEG